MTSLPPGPAGEPRPTAATPEPGRGTTIGAAVLAALVVGILASAVTGSALLVALAPAATPTATPTAVTILATPSPASVPTRVDAADAVAAVAAFAEPSVVTISSGGSFGVVGGSGIVVDADGYLLTTAIVAPDDDTYAVLLADQRETTASVVARDDAHGLVLLRAGVAGLTPARLGSGGALAVGQLVVAVGSPLGEFTDTVTSGIVSSLDRAIDLRDPSTGRRVALDGLIQTDAAINAGSSGGPLLDATGTVVGVIATSAADGQGIGFAVPIDDARDLLARAASGA
jgi:S1-C subfamily serine protease